MVLCGVVQVLRFYQVGEGEIRDDSTSETNGFLFDSRLMSGWEIHTAGGGEAGEERREGSNGLA